MKKFIFIALLILTTTIHLNAQQFKVITSVESIVPNGTGRSRIVNTLEEKDYKDYTSTQTDEGNTRNKSDRSEIRVKNYEETNFVLFHKSNSLFNRG